MYSYGSPHMAGAKAGRPARTYIQQLCEYTGCCPEDVPRAMNDREEWRERVRNIRATSAIWWWWWYILETQRTIILFVYILISEYFYKFLKIYCPDNANFFYVDKDKKRNIKPYFRNNKLDTTLIGELCNIPNDKFIRTVENIIFKWLIRK